LDSSAREEFIKENGGKIISSFTHNLKKLKSSNNYALDLAELVLAQFGEGEGLIKPVDKKLFEQFKAYVTSQRAVVNVVESARKKYESLNRSTVERVSDIARRMEQQKKIEDKIKGLEIRINEATEDNVLSDLKKQLEEQKRLLKEVAVSFIDRIWYYTQSLIMSIMTGQISVSRANKTVSKEKEELFREIIEQSKTNPGVVNLLGMLMMKYDQQTNNLTFVPEKMVSTASDWLIFANMIGDSNIDRLKFNEFIKYVSQGDFYGFVEKISGARWKTNNNLILGLRATVSDIITSVPLLPQSWKDSVSNLLYGKAVNPIVYDMAIKYSGMIEERRETEIMKVMQSIPEEQRVMFNQLLQSQQGMLPVRLSYNDVVSVRNELISRYNLSSQADIDRVRKLSVLLGAYGMGVSISEEETSGLSQIINSEFSLSMIETNPLVAEFALGEMTLGDFIAKIRGILRQEAGTKPNVAYNYDTRSVLEPLMKQYTEYIGKMQENERDEFINQLIERATIRLVKSLFDDDKKLEESLGLYEGEDKKLEVTQIRKVATKIREHLGQVSKIDSLEEMLVEMFKTKGVGEKTVTYLEGLVEKEILRVLKSSALSGRKDEVRVILEKVLGKDKVNDALVNSVIEKFKKGEDFNSFNDLLSKEIETGQVKKGMFSEYYKEVVSKAKAKVKEEQRKAQEEAVDTVQEATNVSGLRNLPNVVVNLISHIRGLLNSQRKFEREYGVGDILSSLSADVIGDILGSLNKYLDMSNGNWVRADIGSLSDKVREVLGLEGTSDSIDKGAAGEKFVEVRKGDSYMQVRTSEGREIFVGDSQKIETIKSSYMSARNLLGDGCIRFSLREISLSDGKKALIVIKERVRDIDEKKSNRYGRG